MRTIKQISRIQPLQQDTIELIPSATIRGELGTATNVVGTVFGGLYAGTRVSTLPLLDKTYKFTVSTVSVTNVQASAYVGGTTPNRVKIATKSTGSYVGVDGNALTVDVVINGLNTALTVADDGNGNLTINSATDGSGDATSTLTDIIGAFSVNTDFAATLEAGGTGSTVITAVDGVLAGGVDAVTGQYTITDVETGLVSGNIAVSGSAVTDRISGISYTISTTLGTTLGDYFTVTNIGDTTYVIPGTVVGKITAGSSAGKWMPVYDDNYTTCNAYAVVSGSRETDKSKLVAETGYETSLADDYHTSIIVFGKLIEASCTAVNMTATTKALLTGIVWE